ncbi:MAG: T9SS type A sorting domain-containing protein, partial [Bacteroidia bacterium]|nr:T9SS type A sorting domain-containing protein [Bacteroidia bacterium]
ALSSWNGIKIFPGGGGGAGHFNNNTPTHGGGNGGGIAFITSNNLIGNGYIITANGQIGGSNISDGASGGGAGGTIIMDVLNSYTGSVTIQANGGNGGNANDGLSSGRCYGAGGGGSGGSIYFTGTTPAVSVNTNGGNAGLEISSDPGCSLILPLSGSNGSITSGYTYTRSMNPAGYCSILLPIGLLYFKAIADQNKAWLQWSIADPDLVRIFIIEKSDNTNNWNAVHSVISKNGTETYHDIDNNPLPGINQYRLKIVEKNNVVHYSQVQKIFIDINKKFEFYPNPASAQINLTGDFSSLTLLTISDPSGKLIWQKKLLSSNKIIKVNLPVLSRGIYIVRINDSIKKLVIL